MRQMLDWLFFSIRLCHLQLFLFLFIVGSCLTILIYRILIVVNKYITITKSV